MYWIDKHYDKERHSVFDTKASLKECCKQNDNPIYDNHVIVENVRSI